MQKLGEERATVIAVEPIEEGGVRSVRLTVEWVKDLRRDSAVLRADLVPEGLAPGDTVEITQAALYRRWRIRLVPNGTASG